MMGGVDMCICSYMYVHVHVHMCVQGICCDDFSSCSFLYLCCHSNWVLVHW